MFLAMARLSGYFFCKSNALPIISSVSSDLGSVFNIFLQVMIASGSFHACICNVALSCKAFKLVGSVLSTSFTNFWAAKYSLCNIR